MSLTSSLTSLSCKIIFPSLRSLNVCPSFSENFCFVTSPSPNSVPISLVFQSFGLLCLLPLLPVLFLFCPCMPRSWLILPFVLTLFPSHVSLSLGAGVIGFCSCLESNPSMLVNWGLLSHFQRRALHGPMPVQTRTFREIWEPLVHVDVKGNSYGPETRMDKWPSKFSNSFPWDWRWSMDGSSCVSSVGLRLPILFSVWHVWSLLSLDTVKAHFGIQERSMFRSVGVHMAAWPTAILITPPPSKIITYAKKIWRNYFRGHCNNSA